MTRKFAKGRGNGKNMKTWKVEFLSNLFGNNPLGNNLEKGGKTGRNQSQTGKVGGGSCGSAYPEISDKINAARRLSDRYVSHVLEGNVLS